MLDHLKKISHEFMKKIIEVLRYIFMLQHFFRPRCNHGQDKTALLCDVCNISSICHQDHTMASQPGQLNNQLIGQVSQLITVGVHLWDNPVGVTRT